MQKDITGQKFNRLTALNFVERRGLSYFWLFECDCGKKKIMHKSGVINGQTKSCGCLHSELLSKKMRGEGNHFWKGRVASRDAFYHWIRDNNEKCGICNICNKKNDKTVWAIKKGTKYSRDINDYVELCWDCLKSYNGLIKISKNGMMKCSRCKTNKRISEFYKNNIVKSHVSSWCKSCCSQTRSERIKNNPRVRLRHNMSNLIRGRLKNRLLSKSGKSTFTFLPYTVDELKQHLEELFEHWMNWKNWGVGVGCWSIDHIKPDSSFDYKSVEDKEFQKCWALKNLRPMDAIENIKKSAKIISY